MAVGEEILAPPARLPARASTLRARRRRTLTQVGVVIGEVVIALLVWEIAVGSLRLVEPIFFPPPSAIGAAFADLLSRGVFADHIPYSLRNFATGYVLAAVVGITAGLAIGSSYALGRLLGPVAWSLYAMPWISIRPATTIWFGFGAEPIIFLVFLASLLPVLLNTMSGVRTVDPALLRAGRVFGGGRVQLWWKVVLPSAVPFVLTGLRLAVISGFIGLLVAELVGSSRGFGALVAIASSRFRVEEAFATIALLVAISVTGVRAVGLLERHVSVWRTRSSSA